MENIQDDKTPLLSVTVLNYNYAHYLPQCLDSILSQTFTDFELILINDCSTDNSLAVIEKYITDPRVRLINHEQNKGFVASLIEGAELSRGKYITVISADDYCVSNQAFATMLHPLEADEAVAFAYSAYGYYADDGVCSSLQRPHGQSYVREGAKEFRDLVLNNYILHSGTIIRRAMYSAAGGYNPSLRFAVDTAIWLHLCALGKVAYCNDKLYAYRTHATNMSASHCGFRSGLREIMRSTKAAFAVMHQGSPISRERSYRRAMQHNLIAVATNTIFAGRLRCGWYAYWCSFCVQPFLTMSQVKTIAILLAYSLLGPNRFRAVRSMILKPKQCPAAQE